MESQKTTITVVATTIGLLVHPASANVLPCGTSGVTVTSQSAEQAVMVCDAVRKAIALFGQCNVPALSSPVRIDIVEDLKEGCTALYHCGEDFIEVLSPPAMQERREAGGAFSHLGLNEYFQSVVVHELSHAASDDIPCPFDACVAADEYIAYTMQIMSLSPDAQLEFENISALNRPISSDELSPIILYLAPDLFAQKVWAHFSQREDACGYIGHLVDGTILIDSERF